MIQAARDFKVTVSSFPCLVLWWRRASNSSFRGGACVASHTSYKTDQGVYKDKWMRTTRARRNSVTLTYEETERLASTRSIRCLSFRFVFGFTAVRQRRRERVGRVEEKPNERKLQ